MTSFSAYGIFPFHCPSSSTFWWISDRSVTRLILTNLCMSRCPKIFPTARNMAGLWVIALEAIHKVDDSVASSNERNEAIEYFYNDELHELLTLLQSKFPVAVVEYD